MPKDTQPFLLSDAAMKAASYSTYENFQPQLSIGPTELQTWKQRIIRFQTQLRAAPTPQQGSLFSTAEPTPKKPTEQAATLDPFSLRRQNTEFWRWQFDDVGVAAMYFVIDYALPARPLLLYIGETVKSNQRWKGVHDCKRYLTNYRQSHYENGLESELAIAFWPHAPEERKARQQLEGQLIYKWRSPFNKENWRYWNTPFVSGKETKE
ncbi:MAG: GIY-YIG nuclease family protein [Cyanobacteria bacterium P01_D01_bin.105]